MGKGAALPRRLAAGGQAQGGYKAHHGPAQHGDAIAQGLSTQALGLAMISVDLRLAQVGNVELVHDLAGVQGRRRRVE
ncbi:hypothetical protein SPOA0351 (plasmid) [Ruegeria pomeroyi DSS-3]|uniref:Uncharacterized protein n=1 Tax=Ruegeria pomeroyi (strain ATCC 700808 / DSM 15171 / DSS-3) TaxID=246200 RepID=Q5LKN0_RUEPO|nr:hypothetical protein SPOA0351 [Ruegeria pomeroyi DSS-3]